ncbi:MAG: Tol-Pal system beta propeller repeat protein TolB [Deltaproteobacteria bacterium]|nr:Tol-Pal system beta propeller repeat protein TolB [Deltaproteobacteria bacterium]
MKISLTKLIGLAFFIFILPGTTSGKIYLDIDQARALFPIAIVEFKNLDGKQDIFNVSKNMEKIISQDLDFTGLFKILDPGSFLENPQTSEITGMEINFRNWSVIGAQGLVKGGFTRKGKQIIIEARLFDVQPGRFLTGRRYIGSEETLRRIAHKFANQIYATLTGERGIFDTKIAYISEDNGKKEVYLMDFDGYNEKRFSYHGSIAISPEWSPDGNWIAFTSYKGGNPSLYIKNYLSREETVVSQYPDLNIAAAWSPDGEEIALTLSKDGNPEIYLIDKAGQSLQRLTKNWAIDVSSTWSPDGKRIAFVSNRSGSPQIYIMDRNGTNIRRLTFQGNYNTEPDWSPRGDMIAFSSLRGSGFQICIIKPDGTGDSQLTQSGNNESPKWSPDGRHIVFCSTRSGGKQIFTMMANGTGIKQLTRKRRNYSPDWSPHLSH